MKVLLIIGMRAISAPLTYKPMKQILTIVALLGLLAGSAFAANTAAKSWTDGLSINSSVGYESEYVFRGVRLNHNSLVTSLEGAYKLYNGSLYAGVLNHDGLSSTYGLSQLYVGYKLPVQDKFTADVGYTFYWATQNNSVPNHSNEIYAGVTYNGLYVNPSAYIYYDFDQSALTAELSGKYSLDLAKYGWANTSLDLGAYVGGVSSGDLLAGYANSKIHDGYAFYGATADLVYSFNKTTAASVGIRYGGNNDGNSIMVQNNEDSFFWGAKVSAGF